MKQLKFYLFVFALFAIVFNSCKKSSDSSILIIDNKYTDPRDGQLYKVVTIGTQTWFAQNLNYATAGSLVYPGAPTEYGRLYTWAGAQIACPAGWHIPSDAEWQILIDYLGGREVAGGNMKSLSGWHSPNRGTNKENSFYAMPAGCYTFYNGSFHDLGYSSCFWSSTAYNDATFEWGRSLYYNYSDCSRDYFDKLCSFSVRCLKN